MKPTLSQVFGMSLTALALVLGMLFYLVFSGSQKAVLEGAAQVRDEKVKAVSAGVSGYLSAAPGVAAQFQEELKRGLVNARDPAALEKSLVSLLLSDPNLGEVTLTYGDAQGFDGDGFLQIKPETRGQVSVVRAATGMQTRFVHLEHDAFVSDRRDLEGEGNFDSKGWARDTTAAVPDPTQHLTFRTPARERFSGTLLWTDLHWSQLDDGVGRPPSSSNRVEVSVVQAMRDRDGQFVGVLRVGLLATQLAHVVTLAPQESSGADPHLVFLCDSGGRLITSGNPAQRFQEYEDDVRIAPPDVPPVIARAMADPHLSAVNADNPGFTSDFNYKGVEYLETFRLIPITAEVQWLVGVVVPQSYYLGGLVQVRNRLLTAFLGVGCLALLGGLLVLRSMRRAQRQMVQESLKMNAFDFSPSPLRSPFRDVEEVLESFSTAKRAMRAMGKYVPVDLVRRLYREKKDPVLGGEPHEITLMFTDIKGFTSLSEKLSPTELADALGRYLDTMARVIQQETHGTIDKYIGDAIMTLWNAPELVPDHACMACLAALRCREAMTALCQSSEWHVSPFTTRFGLHRGTALVGHFGAHDRMNYTAIGDAVNLAARLESLNKEYGTCILASESVVQAAEHRFAFRLIDLVAVHGKQEAVRVYELLSEKQAGAAPADFVTGYEKAFGLYRAGDFAGAITLLSTQAADPPSMVLRERCSKYLLDPPPDDWQGIFRPLSK